MSSPSPHRPPLDVLVIGGGQAGLAMGQALGDLGLRFEILDSGPQIGHAWRSRWDSLRLFTSGRYDNLPGLPFPTAADAYPGKDDVADYLQAYAIRFELPVRLDTPVTSLSRTASGYLVKAAHNDVEARQVVLATGPFQRSFTPPVSAELSSDVQQMHSVDYRRPEELPLGRVLVVGAANSGCQIALELSPTHRVDLSVGQQIPTIPQRPLGRDIWSWATALRLDRVPADSRLGRRLSKRDQIIGTGPKELDRRYGVTLRPRVSAASGRAVTFADGSTGHYDSVVWATGFKPDNQWVNLPNFTDQRGYPRHSRGVTPFPGLYTLGLSWQHTRGSGLLGWVGQDAAFIAEQISSRSR